MKKFFLILLAVTLMLGATSCGIKSEEEILSEKLAAQSRLAKACQGAGGRYVLTIPPGYMSASYWCIWDEEKK